MDLSNYTVDELKTLSDKIAEEVKTRHAEDLESARLLKAEREETFTGDIVNGDTVSFLYNREEQEGVVDRANPKSVTVIFADGKKHYIAYSNVIAIVARAPVEETEDEDETEVAEEVAQ